MQFHLIWNYVQFPPFDTLSIPQKWDDPHLHNFDSPWPKKDPYQILSEMVQQFLEEVRY